MAAFEHLATDRDARDAQSRRAGGIDRAFPKAELFVAQTIAQAGVDPGQYPIADCADDIGLAACYPALGVGWR